MGRGFLGKVVLDTFQQQIKKRVEFCRSVSTLLHGHADVASKGIGRLMGGVHARKEGSCRSLAHGPDGADPVQGFAAGSP